MSHPTPSVSSDRYLAVEEAAELLRLSKSHLNKLRCRKAGPRFVRVGPRCIRYAISDLHQWMQARKVGIGGAR
jgi:excisionase family DNA binding protein